MSAELDMLAVVILPPVVIITIAIELYGIAKDNENVRTSIFGEDLDTHRTYIELVDKRGLLKDTPAETCNMFLPAAGRDPTLNMVANAFEKVTMLCVWM